jgi:branched-chain amino acid transport system substrate-binding protein
VKGRRGLIATLALGVATLALTACGGGAKPATDAGGTYKVMVSGGADAGAQTTQLVLGVVAAKAGVKVANAAGGINGKQIELIESPDNADPQKALENLRAQIAKDKPDAYLVSSGSVVAAAVAPILKQNNIIFLDSGNSADTNKPAENPLGFHLAAPFTAVIDAYTPVFKANNYHKIGVLNGNSAYGKQFGSTAEERFKAAGYEVKRAEYDAKALDFTAEIESVKAFNPDVLVFNGYGGPVGIVLKGITKVGWSVPILGDTSVTSTPLVTTAPPDGLLGTADVARLKIEVTKSVDASKASQATKDGIAAMKSIGTVTATLNNCLNYDAIMLLAAAGNYAKSTDATAIAKALENAEVNTKAKTMVYDTFPFTSSNHEPQLPVETHTFVGPSPIKDGQLGSGV